jgi:hypothetical protein
VPDEARDWEQLRSDAIRAACEVTGDDELAERVTDAVLGVIDDETVRRLSDKLISETYIRSMDFRNGAAMDLEPSRAAVSLWVGAARGLLGDAPNYTEAEMEFGIAEDPQRYVFTVQKAGKMTPHQARKRAESECEELRAELERLRAAEAIEWGVRFAPGPAGHERRDFHEVATPGEAEARDAVAGMQDANPHWEARVVWREKARPAGEWNEEEPATTEEP